MIHRVASFIIFLRRASAYRVNQSSNDAAKNRQNQKQDPLK